MIMEKYKKVITTDFHEFDDKNKTYKNGIFELEITSWQNFQNIIKIFNENTDYFWRGQREDWQLKSSFDRKMSDIKKFLNARNRQEALEIILKQFKKRLCDLPNGLNTKKDDEGWAIGQHYGLPTPLLDWTADPYIAAYFACYKKEKDDKRRVVYALNKAVKRLILKKKDPTTKQTLLRERFIDFLDLTSTSDPNQNVRLHKQKGRFTKSLNGTDIGSNISNYIRKSPEITQNKEILLMKILIPNTLVEECLEHLKFEDITHVKLFPDYSGVAEICKIDLNLEI